MTATLTAAGCTQGAPDRAAAPSVATVEVRPVAETVAVASIDADAADDPAIWAAAPGETALLAGTRIAGFVAGTDKKAGLYIYALDGRQLQFLADGLLNNVDLREGIVIDGRRQVVLGASDRGRMGLALYRFDPASTDRGNAVVPWGFVKSDLGEPYGFCFGKVGDELHALLIGKDGQVRQYRITDDRDGAAGTEVRRFAIGSQSEGCVADDARGSLYINEEVKGLWRYGLAPDAGASRALVQGVDATGRLVADVEGAALIRDGSAAYLLASSQGDSAFAVWRVDGPAPVYAGRFKVAGSGSIDAVSGTDGIDALGGPVGPFPDGLVAVQDDENDGKAQNFKLVDWREIRAALHLQR